MAEQQHFDIIVVGGGPGGYPAAIRAAQRGKKVALIDGGKLGGTCLNRGCIPSKALIASAERFHQISHADSLGIKTAAPTFEYSGLVGRKNQVIDKMRISLERLIKANKVTIIQGWATFTGPRSVTVSEVTYTCDKMIIATGSEPKAIASMPVDHQTILDSTSLLDLTVFPNSILIIGGGVIGCEFASMLSLLGSKVTILEMLPRILPAECQTLSAALTALFTKKGITILTGISVSGVSAQNGQAVVTLSNGDKLIGDKALISVGRSLNTNNNGIEKTGIKVDEKGIVTVNSKMETSVPNVYAVGDIASRWWLAHVATHQGLVAADNACGVESHMHYEAIPNVIFTHPEVASVGLSLDDAIKQGYKASVGHFPFQALGKAQAVVETEGFAQVVIDDTTHQILGAQVIGADASNLIAEVTLAIANELTLECITETIHAHPTLSESWLEASLIAEGNPVHFPPKAPKQR